MEDEERSGRPRDSVTPENIARVQKLIEEDSLYTLTELKLRMLDDCRKSSLFKEFYMMNYTFVEKGVSNT